MLSTCLHASPLMITRNDVRPERLFVANAKSRLGRDTLRTNTLGIGMLITIEVMIGIMIEMMTARDTTGEDRVLDRGRDHGNEEDHLIARDPAHHRMIVIAPIDAVGIKSNKICFIYP